MRDGAFFSGGVCGLLDVFACGGALFRRHDFPQLDCFKFCTYLLLLFLDSQFGQILEQFGRVVVDEMGAGALELFFGVAARQ